MCGGNQWKCVTFTAFVIAFACLRCASPENPFLEPASASVRCVRIAPDSSLIHTGDTIQFEISIYLPYLLDSLSVWSDGFRESVVLYGSTANTWQMDTVHVICSDTGYFSLVFCYWRCDGFVGIDSVQYRVANPAIPRAPGLKLLYPASEAVGVTITPHLFYDYEYSDFDTVEFTILLGRTLPLGGEQAIVSGTNDKFFRIQSPLLYAATYYWRVIAEKRDAAGVTYDTSSVDSFFTENRPPIWRLPLCGDTSVYGVTLDLVDYCSDPDSHAMVFSVIDGRGAQIDGTLLHIEADSQEIRLLATDRFAVQSCSSVAIFRVWNFRDSRMRRISGGTYVMGQEGVAGPVHPVTLSSFWIDTVEVRQSDYSFTVSRNPSYFFGADRPVEMITWFDAVLYCNARSRQTGLDTAYRYSGGFFNEAGECTLLTSISIDTTAFSYRLPTEAQWEYAYRSGTSTAYYWGNSDEHPVIDMYAWFFFNSHPDYTGVSDSTAIAHHPVALLPPNGSGLYDMAGNVGEWVEDLYGPYSTTHVENPIGPDTGDTRINRGGSWATGPESLTAARRSPTFPYDRNYATGMRVVFPDKRSNR